MAGHNLDFCRLCCATTNLLNMFTGKFRSFRDMLRKMMKETLYIQVEPNDPVQSICISCLIDVTNFYYFKLHCHQKQNTFKYNGPDIPMIKKPKFQIPSLDEIELPDIATTTEIMDWLALKQKDKRLESQNFTPCEKLNRTFKACQETSIERKDESCQTDISAFFETNIETNGDLIDSKNKCPSDFSKSRIDKSVQCSLLSAKTVRRSVNRNLKNHVSDKCCETDLTLQVDATQKQDKLCHKITCSLISETPHSKDKNLEVESSASERSVLSTSYIQSISNPKNQCIKSPPTSTLLEVKPEKSVKVTICHVCDQSLYNRREVNKHVKSHMWCYICRKKFRSVNLAQAHTKSCHVPHVQGEAKYIKDSNLALFVNLVKIDSYPNFKTNYPIAYGYLRNISVNSSSGQSSIKS